MQKENTPRIYIQTLGGLTISCNGKSVSNISQKSRKTWILLAYLIIFRNKAISSDELFEILWDDEGVDPAGSLKTLLFRTRKLLEPLGLPTQKLIVRQQDSYAWTKEYETVVDIDLFDSYCKTAFAVHESADTCIEAGLKAVELYKGDFLTQSTWESWVIPINTYYHTLYLKMVHRLLELYDREHSYQQIILLCRQAIAIEVYDEDLYYHLIHTLYDIGNIRAAQGQYKHMTRLFYNELAITPSSKLNDLYKLIENDMSPTSPNLSSIQLELQSNSSKEGAFFCEYSVFKDIYLRESRAIGRTDASLHLCLIVAENGSGEALQPPLLTDVMDDLHNCITNLLRKGDVFSRYTPSQYILLLPTTTYENGENILKRIFRKFDNSTSYENVKLSYSLETVYPPL